MKVFISWSGEPSKSVAQAIYDWMPFVIQAADPFMSPNIDKGDRWDPKLDKELEAATVGIVVLTRNNLSAPWILFEAGALAKIKTAKVCTILYDIRPSQIEFPLAKFQHTVISRDDFWKLVQTISEAGPRLPPEVLKRSFELHWPELEKRLGEIRASSPVEESAPKRRAEDMLEELVALSRSTAEAVAELRRPERLILGQALGPATKGMAWIPPEGGINWFQALDPEAAVLTKLAAAYQPAEALANQEEKPNPES
jgi:hypothetical protein